MWAAVTQSPDWAAKTVVPVQWYTPPYLQLIVALGFNPGIVQECSVGWPKVYHVRQDSTNSIGFRQRLKRIWSKYSLLLGYNWNLYSAVVIQPCVTLHSAIIFYTAFHFNWRISHLLPSVPSSLFLEIILYCNAACCLLQLGWSIGRSHTLSEKNKILWEKY